METESDIELVRAWREQRSEDAFTTLVDRHSSLVYGVAYRLTGSPHLAEEVAQEVFVLLAQKAHGFHPRVVVPGWLHTTSRHIALRVARNQNRRLRRELSSSTMSAQPTPKLEEERNWELATPHIDAAIAELADRDRDALLLRFFAGRSHREVGLAQNTSEDAARKRISRALERVRCFLIQRGVTISAAACTAMFVVGASQGIPSESIRSTAQHAIQRAKIDRFEADPGDRFTFLSPLRSSPSIRWLAAISTTAVLLLLGVALVGGWASRGRPPIDSARVDLAASFRARAAASRAKVGSVPAGDAARPAYRIAAFPSPGARVERLLDQIVLPEFRFDALPLADAIHELNRLTKIGMQLPGLRNESSIGVVGFAYPPDSDANGDAAIYQSITITASHTHSGLSLRDALDLVVAGASQGLHASIGGEGICLMLSHPSERSVQVLEIEPEIFGLPDPDQLMRMPETESVPLVRSRVHDFFGATGMQQESPFLARYAFRDSALFVSGSNEQVDRARRALLAANKTSPRRTQGLEMTVRLMEATLGAIQVIDDSLLSAPSIPISVNQTHLKELLRTSAKVNGMTWMELNSELLTDRSGVEFWGPLRCGSIAKSRLTLRIKPQPGTAGMRLSVFAGSVPIQGGSESATPSDPLSSVEWECETMNDEALLFEIQTEHDSSCPDPAIRRFVVVSMRTIEPAPHLR